MLEIWNPQMDYTVFSCKFPQQPGSDLYSNHCSLYVHFVSFRKCVLFSWCFSFFIRFFLLAIILNSVFFGNLGILKNLWNLEIRLASHCLFMADLRCSFAQVFSPKFSFGPSFTICGAENSPCLAARWWCFLRTHHNICKLAMSHHNSQNINGYVRRCSNH